MKISWAVRLMVALLIAVLAQTPAMASQEDFNAGYQYGYSDGFDAATSEDTVLYYYNGGYDDGYKDGQDSGYSAGYSSGHSAGYSIGYSAGYDDGSVDSASQFGTLHGSRLREAFEEGYVSAWEEIAFVLDEGDSESAELNERIEEKETQISDMKVELALAHARLEDSQKRYRFTCGVLLAALSVGAIFAVVIVFRKHGTVERLNAWKVSYQEHLHSILNQKLQAKTRMESSPRGVMWLRFCMNWRYPASLVFGVISFVSTYWPIGFENILSSPLYLASLAIDLPMLAILLLLAFNIKRLNLLSFRLNQVFLVLEVVVRSFVGAMEYMEFLAVHTAFAICFCIWCAIVTMPNFIYFNRRRYLFDPNAAFPAEVNGKIVQGSDVKLANTRTLLMLVSVGVVLTILLLALFPQPTPPPPSITTL